MSSVSSSDRRRQDDRINKTREEYEAKETESQKKQRAELEALKTKHHGEINRLSDDFGKEMEQLKQHYRETLNERDQANIRKTDDVRNLYKDQLKRKTEENDSDRRIMRNASSGALQKQKTVAENQRENLMENQKAELKSRDESFRETSGKAREEMKSSLVKHDERLKDAHEKEMNVTVVDRDNQIGNKERDIRELRKSYDGKLKAERNQRESEVGRWQQKNRDTVEIYEGQNADNMKTQSMVLKGELTELNRKYNTALDKKVGQLDNANDDLRDSVNNRLDSQVRSKQSQINRLNSKLNNEMVNGERLRNIERRDLESRYMGQMDIVEKQKQGAVEAAREQANKRVGQSNEKNEKLVRETTRHYKNESGLTKLQTRQDRELLIQQQKDAVEQVAGTAESRVKKISKVARENQDAYASYFDNSLDQMKENYAGKVEAQREASADDMVTMNKGMTERFRGMEKTHNQRLEGMVEKYESKINQMKDNHEKELKRVEQYYGSRLQNKDKEGKQTSTSLEMKYEAKIAQLNESHGDQLDKMNRRHQEDMQNLATRLSNYSKKA